MAKHPTKVEVVTVDVAEVEHLRAQGQALLPKQDAQTLGRVIDSLLLLTRLVRERGTTIARLRRLVGFPSSEKTTHVLGAKGSACATTAKSAAPDGAPAAGDAAGTGASDPSDTAAETPSAAPSGGGSPPNAAAEPPPKAKPPKAKGHGRVPASDYTAAVHIAVPHATLRLGDGCPKCAHGKLFEIKEPTQFLRIVGQSPLAAVCWDCQRLRCSGCGHVFTARAPEEAQGDKYTETAASMTALLRFGAGMPHYRLDHLQRDLRTPVPDATQWDVLQERAEWIKPAYGALVRYAAQGSVVHNDDTHMGILDFMGKRREKLLASGQLADPDRTGLFTTGIVSITEGKPVALFFTGRKHAGENLADLLRERAADLDPPIHMCDALSRNLPKGHEVIESNCIAHGRRNFVDEIDNFPAECRHLLESLGKVYKVDEDCRKQGLTPEQRLRAHRQASAPVIEALHVWMTAQLADKHVEPNSGLGEAFNYLLKRWDKFTLFLRKAGAPLDNNICERALKKAILHRNNSLFYRTLRGAGVGDLYMSLIYTAEIHGENPFDYLTALQRHDKDVAQNPTHWLPWNYRATLARAAPAPAAARGEQRPPPSPPTRAPPVRTRPLTPSLAAPLA